MRGLLWHFPGCFHIQSVRTSLVSGRRVYPSVVPVDIFSASAGAGAGTPNSTPLPPSSAFFTGGGSAMIGLWRTGRCGRGNTYRFLCDLLFQQKPLNPRRHHRPNKETKTSLNSVVPNRISVAPGSTSMRPALCATSRSKTNLA
jgi:hypothetical protein